MDSVQLNFNQQTLQLLNIILGFIMFGVALDMRVEDFRRVARRPVAVGVGLLSQFILLPGLTFLMVWLIGIQPSIGLGMILVASCPGGNISNFVTNLAGGNTALSVSMTAVSTLASIVMTPFNLNFWGALNPSTRSLMQQIAIDPVDMFFTIAILLGIPMMIGLYISERHPDFAKRLKRGMRIFSIGFFALFVAGAFAANFDHFLSYIGAVALLVAVHNAVGLLTGYYMAYAVKLPEYDRRAVAIEVGMQNSGLGLILIFTFFNGLGGMAIIAAWWGIWHILSGMGLAYYWRRSMLTINLA